MANSAKQKITVQATVNAPIEKVWRVWNNPSDIEKWNTASEDWQSSNAKNDLRVGGKFSCHMSAKDGSFGFDFEGTYNEIKTNELISYTIADGRLVNIVFEALPDNSSRIIETFEAEETNPIELQQGGWQAIMNNFKQYTENLP